MNDEGHDMVSMLEQIVKDATAPTQSPNSPERSESITQQPGSSVDPVSDKASTSAVPGQGSVASSNLVERGQDSTGQQFYTQGTGISAAESEARIVSAMSAIANSGSGSNGGAVEQPLAQVAFLDTPTPAPVAPTTPAPTSVPDKPVTAAPVAAPVVPITPAPTSVPAQPATPVPTSVPAKPATPVPTAVPAKPATPAPTAVPAKPATPASPAVPASSDEHTANDNKGIGNTEGKGNNDDADSSVSPVESPVFEITPTVVIKDTDETPIVVEPTPDHLPEPTVEPTPEVSPEPTVEPTPVPTVESSPEPTDNEETEKAEATAEIAATPTPEPESSSPGKSGSGSGHGKGLTK
jgi:hypothetical protein